MTGEVHSITQDGTDSNGESWPIHAAISRAVGGELHPFDSYQGPYISVGGDIRVGNPPYAIAPKLPGIARLWVCYESDCEAIVYREDTDQKSAPFFPYDKESAITAALSLLALT